MGNKDACFKGYLILKLAVIPTRDIETLHDAEASKKRRSWKMIHQRQLFHAAVARMASSSAPLHDRILQAYEAFKSVRADDFMSEPNIRDAYIALLVMLKGGLRVSTVGSDISTTIRGLTGEQASVA